MAKIFKYPFWENYQKDRITCKLIRMEGDKEVGDTVVINKFQEDGTENPDFNEVIKQNTIEKIDANTAEREERHRTRHEEEKRRAQERKQAQKLEELFNAKLEIFEVDTIKDSKNRKLKSKIRRAKNIYEMMAYTTMLLQDELNEEQAAQ